MMLELVAQTASQLVAKFANMFVSCAIVAFQLLDRRDDCSHRHRMAVVGAGGDHLGTRNDVHDLALAAECRNRKPAADRLGERCDIGRHAEVSLRTANAHAKAGYDFVENEHDAKARAKIPDTLQVARLRHAAVQVHHHGLHVHGGDVATMALEQRRQCVQIVPFDHERVGERMRCAAARIAHLRKCIVVMRAMHRHRVRWIVDDAANQFVKAAIVVPVEAHDLVAAGVGARDADRIVVGLGAAAGEAHEFGAGNMVDDLPRGFVLELVDLVAVHFLCLANDRLTQVLVAVPEDRRAIAQRVVDVLVAVEINKPRTRAVRHVYRQIAFALSVIALDPARDEPARPVEMCR